MKIETFEDIQAWQKGRELTNKMYDITRSKEFDKDRGLRDQLRRAAVSIVSNIAEGFERNTDNLSSFSIWLNDPVQKLGLNYTLHMIKNIYQEKCSKKLLLFVWKYQKGHQNL